MIDVLRIGCRAIKLHQITVTDIKNLSSPVEEQREEWLFSPRPPTYLTSHSSNLDSPSYLLRRILSSGNSYLPSFTLASVDPARVRQKADKWALGGISRRRISRDLSRQLSRPTFYAFLLLPIPHLTCGLSCHVLRCLRYYNWPLP